jgi:hypothetical protein
MEHKGFACRFLLVLLAVIISSLSGISAMGQTTPDVVHHVASREKVEAQQLQIVNQAVADYPLTGKQLTVYKVLDQQTGEIWRTGTSPRGEWIDDVDDHAASERAAYHQRYGKLTPALATRLEEASNSDDLPVAIWATVPIYLYRVYLPLVSHSSSSSMAGAKTMYTSPASDDPQESVVDYLQSLGYEPEYISEYTPIVYAILPPSVIDSLSNQASVAYMDEAREYDLHIYSAARTIAAPWTWSRGYTGQGVTVAVIENDGIDFGHQALNGNVAEAWRYYRPGNPNFGGYPLNHATLVAGVIASTDPTNRGIADSVTLLSGNAGTNWIWDLQAASEWAIDHGANVLNYSLGDDRDRNLGNFDRVVDWLVWKRNVTVVVSAGNSVHGPNVASPAKSFNVIAVGSKDDQNTANSESDVCDDTMSSFSAYLDPISTHGDRQKPDVVAVGQRLVTTDVGGGWTGGTTQGTSFSAPAVAGEVALMMSRASWLKIWPETVRAVVMASARWNVEGDRRLSDRDGAGAVDTTAADNSLLNNRMKGLMLHEDDLPYEVQFEVNVPERIRVAIAWNSHPTSGEWWQFWQTDPLKADLDLTIYAPNGSVVGGSYSFDNSYEIVEFMAPTTGTYRTIISKGRWDDDNPYEYVGWGWYSGAELPSGCP